MTPADSTAAGAWPPGAVGRTLVEPRPWWPALGCVTLFFALALFSIFLSRQPGGVATVWYANAVAVGCLLTEPTRRWPVLFLLFGIANTAANWVWGDPPGQALLFVPANLAEILFSSALLLRTGWHRDLNVNNSLKIAGLVGFLAPALSATLGAALLRGIGMASFASVWDTWYAGSAIGAVSLLPLVLLRPAPRELMHERALWLALLLVTLVIIATLALLNRPFTVVSLALVTSALWICQRGMAVLVFWTSLLLSTALALGWNEAHVAWSGMDSLRLYVPMLATLLPSPLLAAVLQQLHEREQALRRSEARWQFALEGAGHGVWDWDIVSGRIYRSPALLKMLGMPAETPAVEVGDWRERLHPDDRDALARELQAHLRGDVPMYEMDLRLAGADGQYRWIRARGVVVERDADGRPLRLIGTCTDISQHKALELMQNQFVSTVSHELRTPLTAMHGALELLQRLHGTRLPEPAQALLDVAARNTQRLVGLVNGILDYEKLRMAPAALPLQPVVLTGVLDDTLRSLAPYAARFPVEFDRAAVPADLPALQADPDRLQQVLTNLLSNAAKFSPPGSTVRINAAVRAGEVEIRIWNAGPPIPAAFRERLFQPFQQADGSDGRQREGTGLGLAISQRLVEAMHGTIGVESSLDAGTTFWVRLPQAA